ncbi:hypothetical protein [Rhizobium sp. CECT 9324]|uniref:hypothetical protein n=1 Tax=Rhizobium sp. CECT 9324 TaxID=2845820 RepID=UPI001E40FBCE|nr:hypothetical protein [Rhizobium sp. CECT 9324]
MADAGQRFFMRLEPALEGIAEAAEALRGFNAKPSKRLRINSDATVAEPVLSPLNSSGGQMLLRPRQGAAWSSIIATAFQQSRSTAQGLPI